MRILKDKVAFITGAGSGIGRALATCLAAEGCEIALNDVAESHLEDTARIVRPIAPKVTVHPCDISDRDSVYCCVREVIDAHGRIDIVINNAAVALVETIEDVTYEDFEWLMRINFWGVVYCTKAFLPYLKQRPEAHIVNVSSIDAILTTPNNGPYCAAKSAVKAFTDTLLQELHDTDVRVSCVLPGGVKTHIHRNARFFKQACSCVNREESIEWFESAAMTSPARAARAIVDGIKKNKTRILIGRDARFIDLMTRLVPGGSLICASHVMKNLNKSRPNFLGWLVQMAKRRCDE